MCASLSSIAHVLNIQFVSELSSKKARIRISDDKSIWSHTQNHKNATFVISNAAHCAFIAEFQFAELHVFGQQRLYQGSPTTLHTAISRVYL